MTDSTHATLLRRMTRSQDTGVVENPLTSSRAVRLALTKAANDTVGLSLSVTSVAEEVRPLDDMLEALPDDLMLLRLHRDGALTGLIALDMQLRAAVLEMETMGTLSAQPVDPRPPTRADKMLCDPMIVAFLHAFPQAVRGTGFDGWGDGVTHNDRIADKRAAGLLLEDQEYRVVQMNVQLGPADRQGLLLMALPLIETPDACDVPLPDRADWGRHFPDVIAAAPASLTALLHRFKIPLATAQAMQVGTVVPLAGCSVNSVRLLGPDGQEVAQAKLGQSGGMRAVRLQAPPSPDLQDLPSPIASAGPTMAVEELPDPMTMMSPGLDIADPPDPMAEDAMSAPPEIEMDLEFNGLDQS